MNSARHHYGFLTPILLLIIAYEWIISFLNKLFVKDYFKNMHEQMSQSISGVQIHSYGNMVQKFGLPNYHLIGILVPLSEIFVGVSFLIIAILKWSGLFSPGVARWGVVASILAAFMSLNYALLGGDTLLVNANNAFQEGISIDWLLFMVEVVLIFYFYHYSPARRRGDA